MHSTPESDTWQSVKGIEHPVFEMDTIGKTIRKAWFLRKTRRVKV